MVSAIYLQIIQKKSKKRERRGREEANVAIIKVTGIQNFPQVFCRFEIFFNIKEFKKL